VSLVRFKANNHPQQVAKTGRRVDIDDRGTDPALFAALNDRFRFTLDVAAAAHNAKCEAYFDAEVDGLKQSWARERVWCNPPYSAIEPWVMKAWTETDAMTVMLLPANRAEQKWWQWWIEPFRDRGDRLRIEFLPGRPRFIMYSSGFDRIEPNQRPPFGLLLAIWS
jgi:phage N-6-adenine-methyltransferase